MKLSRQALQPGRRRKSDPIDTQAIAHCLSLGQVLPSHFATGQALQFKEWGKRYGRNEHDKRQIRTRVSMQLDRL